MPARRHHPNVAIEAMLRAPSAPPLPGLLHGLLGWAESRHLGLMADAGFDDVRRAHNSVFVHLPAEGRRLTDLADAADITKQAMGELVDDLVRKGYLDRVPDPTDGRAKLIVWAERGLAAHDATLKAFAEIGAEAAEAIGEDRFGALQELLLELLGAVTAEPGGPTPQHLPPPDQPRPAPPSRARGSRSTPASPP